MSAGYFSRTVIPTINLINNENNNIIKEKLAGDYVVVVCRTVREKEALSVIPRECIYISLGITANNCELIFFQIIKVNRI